MYSDEYFEKWYGCRSPEAYLAVLGEVIVFGRPGLLVDLGAGTGLLAELAWRWGIAVRAFEGSQFAVDTAKERCPDLPIQQHQLTDPLPLDDGCAESVVLNQVIEHLDQGTAQRVLAEAHRVLGPSGRLIILSPSRRNQVERDADPTHIHLYLPSELDALLKAASFRIVRHLNAGFWFLPRSRAGMHLGRLALRFLPQDAFSATANVVAEPDHGELQR